MTIDFTKQNEELAQILAILESGNAGYKSLKKQTIIDRRIHPMGIPLSYKEVVKETARVKQLLYIAEDQE